MLYHGTYGEDTQQIFNHDGTYGEDTHRVSTISKNNYGSIPDIERILNTGEKLIKLNFIQLKRISNLKKLSYHLPTKIIKFSFVKGTFFWLDYIQKILYIYTIFIQFYSKPVYSFYQNIITT